MHSCKGCDTCSRRERVWHGLYGSWLDHRDSGHKFRAAVFGWLADAVVPRNPWMRRCRGCADPTPHSHHLSWLGRRRYT